jgi:hypothetical protein
MAKSAAHHAASRALARDGPGKPHGIVPGSRAAECNANPELNIYKAELVDAATIGYDRVKPENEGVLWLL